MEKLEVVDLDLPAPDAQVVEFVLRMIASRMEGPLEEPIEECLRFERSEKELISRQKRNRQMACILFSIHSLLETSIATHRDSFELALKEEVSDLEVSCVRELSC